MDGVELLGRLVSMNSVFPNESRLAHFLALELEYRELQVRVQRFGEGRYNILATRAGKGKPILLAGHIDTVPPYGYQESGRDPLRLEERDGKLYGLGAYDMKAGIAAILRAIENSRSGRALKVMFVSDEENQSRGCHEAIRSGFLRDVEFALVPEISDVHDISESTRTIMLGRRGRAQYQIDVPGKSYHAARPENGLSAITEASKFALEIEQMNEELPSHPELGKGSQLVSAFQAQSTSLSVPDRATIVVDRHLVLPENAETAGKSIQNRINRLYEQGISREANGNRATVSIKPREVPYLMPYVTPQSNGHVQRLGQIIQETLGCEPRYNFGLSVADENLMAMQGIPVASFGPIGSGEHSCNEWVSKKSYLELIEVLERFISS